VKVRPIIAATAVVAPWCAEAWAAAGAEVEHRGVDWFGLVFFAINFAIFVTVAVYFARPLVATFLRDRADAIRSTIERARNALAEAEQLSASARARAAVLDSDMDQLASELAAETTYQMRQIVEGARAGATRIRTDTEQAAAALAELAQRRVRERLAATSAALARELILRSFRPSDQARLIDGFMDRLGQESRP
jgi:F-type H+-transporting ATPase subunit b